MRHVATLVTSNLSPKLMRCTGAALFPARRGAKRRQSHEPPRAHVCERGGRGAKLRYGGQVVYHGVHPLIVLPFLRFQPTIITEARQHPHNL
jgi:hypothetical protein